jgi:hypothetical protein
VDLRVERLLVGEPFVTLGSSGREVNRRDHASTVTVIAATPEAGQRRRRSPSGLYRTMQ